MKNIIAISAIAISLSACSGYDENNCRETVVKQFNTQNVVSVAKWKYVVKDADGDIWYVETMNASDTNITKKTPIFFRGGK